MAIAAAPHELDEAPVEPRIRLVSTPRSAPRWGPPIWAADEPIAALDRVPLSQIDIIIISALCAYRAD